MEGTVKGTVRDHPHQKQRGGTISPAPHVTFTGRVNDRTALSSYHVPGTAPVLPVLHFS